MALLNTVPFRPSCVVSALPHRFRRELERQLAGSVAISTCGVDQLEDAVRSRGATIAVVGASEDSWEIAERLSHNSQGVRVYMAHYQDKAVSKSAVNGFAGIFDMRMDQQKLAETIRQEAVALNQKCRPKTFGFDQQHILEHFVAINERLSRPQLAYELMLDGFLGLTGAEAGVLLLSQDPVAGIFRVAASKDCEFTDTFEFAVPNDLVLQMWKGEILFLPEGLSGVRCHSWFVASEFCVCVPLVAGNQLQGCLIAQTNEAPGTLAEYGSVTGHLLSLMWRREATLVRGDIISAARKKINAKWMLVDSTGRIIHCEGGAAEYRSTRSRIKFGRLAHAVCEALDGRTGTITYKNQLVSYERLSAPDGDFALLRWESRRDTNAESPTNAVEQNTAELIKDQLASPTDSAGLVKSLIEADQASFLEPTVTAKALHACGVQFAEGQDKDSLFLPPAAALIALCIMKRFEGQITFSLTRFGQSNGLTFEIAEESLERHPSFLGSDFLIEMVLHFTGLRRLKPHWIFGTFGGRLEWLEGQKC